MLVETKSNETALSEYELDRGKPIPNKQHSITQANLLDVLLRYKQQYKRLPELSLRLLGEKFVPDIALYATTASDWHQPETEMTLPPLLAIEIVSPSQTMEEMTIKAHKYIAAGVRSVWLVLPLLAGVMVLHTGQKTRFFSEGNLVDEELGIEIPIDEVFE